MMKLLAFAAVAMTLLAGCMLGPDYQRPTLPLPAQYRDAEPPAPGREAVSLADLQWFQLFQDDSLAGPAYDSHTTELRRAHRGGAHPGGPGTARHHALLPVPATRCERYHRQRSSLGRDAFYLHPQGQNEGNTFFLGLSLFYEIDLWGRLRRETEAARAELLSTEWAQRAVLVTLGGGCRPRLLRTA